MSVKDSPQIFAELRKEARKFPRRPGVYLMRNRSGEVIYVGKAKDLRARVGSYFSGSDERQQIRFLVSRIAAIEKIVTESEAQAFILERDLITKYKPRYNIRLKDDKAFLSVRVDRNSPWPRLELVRRVADDGARYFGPYSFSYELRNLLEIIRRIVPLRSCSNTVFYNRQRPCLEYQIKRCAGPCCLPVDPEEYDGWVKQAISVLEGRTEKLEIELKRTMEQAAANLDFEEAAILRDRLATLASLKEGKPFVSAAGDERDVFGLYREEQLVSLSVFRIRNGRISDNTNFPLTDVQLSDDEVMQSAIEQFYARGREIPSEIVIPCAIESSEVLSSILAGNRGGLVEIVRPFGGIKFRLVKLAELNAREHFAAHFGAEERYIEVARTLARVSKLKQVPRRIECIDISNLQGSDIVGAAVVFFDGIAQKNLYRKYRIAGSGKPDDFGAIHEVVYRRLQRAISEGTIPDLVIIDGGPGQLGAALRARDELGVSVEMIALAKMKLRGDRSARERERLPERIYLDGVDQPIRLKENDEVTRFMQRIRNEAHRFGLAFHRKSRGKRVFASVLDGIPGVGAERKRRLIAEFGTVEAMRAALPEDLARVGRMPKSLALKVLRILASGYSGPH